MAVIKTIITGNSQCCICLTANPTSVKNEVLPILHDKNVHRACTREMSETELYFRNEEEDAADSLPPSGPILPTNNRSVSVIEAWQKQEEEERARRVIAEEKRAAEDRFREQQLAEQAKTATEQQLRRRTRATRILGEDLGGVDWESGGEIRAGRMMRERVLWLQHDVLPLVKFPALIFALVVVLLYGASGMYGLYQRAYGIDAYGAAPDAAALYRDAVGRLVIDPYQTRVLKPRENVHDAEVVNWIRQEARFWRLKTAQIAQGYAETWLYGARRVRNVSLSQISEALQASNHQCAYAVHLGVPIHAIYEAAPHDRFMVEPRLGAASAEIKTYILGDILLSDGEQITRRVPWKLWIDYADVKGVKHHELIEGGSVACVIYGTEMVERARLFDEHGQPIARENVFDRDDA